MEEMVEKKDRYAPKNDRSDVRAGSSDDGNSKKAIKLLRAQIEEMGMAR